MLFALLSLAISTAAECFNSLTNFNDFPKTADEEVDDNGVTLSPADQEYHAACIVELKRELTKAIHVGRSSYHDACGPTSNEISRCLHLLTRQYIRSYGQEPHAHPSIQALAKTSSSGMIVSVKELEIAKLHRSASWATMDALFDLSSDVPEDDNPKPPAADDDPPAPPAVSVNTLPVTPTIDSPAPTTSPRPSESKQREEGAETLAVTPSSTLNVFISMNTVSSLPAPASPIAKKAPPKASPSLKASPSKKLSSAAPSTGSGCGKNVVSDVAGDKGPRGEPAWSGYGKKDPIFTPLTPPPIAQSKRNKACDEALMYQRKNGGSATPYSAMEELKKATSTMPGPVTCRPQGMKSDVVRENPFEARRVDLMDRMNASLSGPSTPPPPLELTVRRVAQAGQVCEGVVARSRRTFVRRSTTG